MLESHQHRHGEVAGQLQQLGHWAQEVHGHLLQELAAQVRELDARILQLGVRLDRDEATWQRHVEQCGAVESRLADAA